MPRKGVLDPQGKAIQAALHSLGYDAVQDLRAGKSFEIVLADLPGEKARALLEEMSAKLLANPVIESWRIELEEE